MAWTDEKVARLKQYVREDVPYDQIGQRLGMSLGAVAGKVARLGIGKGKISSREGAVRRRMLAAQTRAKRSAADAKVVKARRPEAPELPPPDERHIQAVLSMEIDARHRAEGMGAKIDELQESHCRYPKGDPRSDDFEFCADEKVKGLPYCEFHASKCFNTQELHRSKGVDLRQVVKVTETEKV